MSYRKHGNSKGARRAHHKREKIRRRKLREKGGQVEPFGYADVRGRDRKQLRVMSVTKGARDGSPRYDAIAMETRSDAPLTLSCRERGRDGLANC